MHETGVLNWLDGKWGLLARFGWLTGLAELAEGLPEWKGAGRGWNQGDLFMINFLWCLLGSLALVRSLFLLLLKHEVHMNLNSRTSNWCLFSNKTQIHQTLKTTY